MTGSFSKAITWQGVMQGEMRQLGKAQTIRVYQTKPGRIQPGFPAPRNNVKLLVVYIRQTVIGLCRNREF
jgi:hypothetical protein